MEHTFKNVFYGEQIHNMNFLQIFLAKEEYANRIETKERMQRYYGQFKE